jgi:ribulose-phosphate 3-epimerase
VLKFAPSILAADFSRLGEQIYQAEKAGADMIHLDVIDGHFAPNITFGPAVAKMSKTVCSLPHDAHLMVTDPEHYIEEFARIGIEYITFHLEIGGERKDLGQNRWVYVIKKSVDRERVLKVIDSIRTLGRKAGLTINPPTEFDRAIPFLDKIDLLLLMSVNPGFAGQAFMDNVYAKIETARKYRDDKGLGYEIMVDGGVDLENAHKLSEAGTDILVSGSSFFKSSNYPEFIRKLKS